MHEPSAISAVSVHEKGVVIVLADDGVEKFTCEVDVADRWRQLYIQYSRTYLCANSQPTDLRLSCHGGIAQLGRLKFQYKHPDGF